MRTHTHSKQPYDCTKRCEAWLGVVFIFCWLFFCSIGASPGLRRRFLCLLVYCFLDVAGYFLVVCNFLVACWVLFWQRRSFAGSFFRVFFFVCVCACVCVCARMCAFVFVCVCVQAHHSPLRTDEAPTLPQKQPTNDKKTE